LAKHGVLDALTKVLAKIHEAQPENPLEFLETNFAVSLKQQETIRDLEEKLNVSSQDVVRLQKEVDRLKQQQFNNKGAVVSSKDKEK